MVWELILILRNPTALIILNSQFVPLGTLEAVLIEKNYSITYLDATQEDIKTISPTDPDLVVVLGGPQSPYEQEKYPYLRDEIEFLKIRIQQDMPTIGIALGAQLIACSQNATVVSGSSKGLNIEIGWYNLDVKNEILSMYNNKDSKVLIWQNDFYEPPKNSIVLASASSYGCQAFQIGKNCLALQFHAEVTQAIIDVWIEKLPDDLLNASVDENELKLENKKYIDMMMENSEKLWSSWLERQ